MLKVIRKIDKSDNFVVEKYKEILFEYSRRLTYNIRMAHNIYVKTQTDYEMRRGYQNKAIAICYVILEEIEFLFEIFPKAINLFDTLIKQLNEEITILKGWRTSNDKISKTLE